MSFISVVRTPPAQIISVFLAELLAPLASSLAGENNTAFHHQQFNISEAE
jgi:hypothetical protein